MKARTVDGMVQTIIVAFGGPAALARELKLPFGTVRQWHRRDSIPARYWASVCSAAKRKRVYGVNIDRFIQHEARTALIRRRRRSNSVNSGGNHEPHPIDQA